MGNYTLSDSDTSVGFFCGWLNDLIGGPHPNHLDRLITGIVSVNFVLVPYFDSDYQRTYHRLDAYAVVETATAVEIG